MIRLTLLYLAVIGLAGYAFRDWFKSLCGLILMMAVIEHPDMPKTLFGIQGLNLWNALLGVVVLAWAIARRRERLRFDLPKGVVVLLSLYLVVIVVGFVRLLGHRDVLAEEYTFAAIVSEYIINTVKWLIPGLLLFDGCRDRTRFVWGLACSLAVYFLLAIQVIKWMPMRYAVSGEDLENRSAKILVKEVGYHRVNLSMMLGGASWAIFAARGLSRSRFAAAAVVAASGVVLFGQALTAGRTGYATWGAVGLVLCLLRWRKYLLLAPVAGLLVALLIPGAADRLSQGFAEPDPLMDEAAVDAYAVTSGRNLIWPYVIEKIKERPWTGYGRLAMKTTGLQAFLWTELGEAFPHPHNAYLEMLFDNGWLGFLVAMPFYVLVLWRAFALFRDSRSPVFVAAGGAAAALVLALMVAGFGSQTFYPREGAVGMWCAIGLLLRVHVERDRALARLGEESNPAPARPRPFERPTRARVVPAPPLEEFLWRRAS